MSSHNIFFFFFCGEIKKKYYPFYLELRITKKNHLGLAKTGLNCGVVLFSSGLIGATTKLKSVKR